MGHVRMVLKGWQGESLWEQFGGGSATAQGLRTLKLEDDWGRSRQEGWTSVMGISSKSSIKTHDV